MFRKYGKQGHFQKVCRSVKTKLTNKVYDRDKSIGEQLDNGSSEGCLFTIKEINKNLKKATVAINEIPIEFIVDTDSSVTITDQSTPLISTPKKDRDIRIVMWHANETISREGHPIPTLQQLKQ